MSGSPLAQVRRCVGWALSGVFSIVFVWFQVPGIPVLCAPNASAELKAAGSALFEHEWQPGDVLATGDGLGPVFNERSCVACHFQGGVGGGGDAKHNVTAFEADPVEGRPGVQSGVLHTFAVAKDYQESPASLREFFPIVPGGVKVVGGCTVQTRDFDPVRMQAVNATALFGAGWIDRISSKTILYESRRRSLESIGKEITGEPNGTRTGRPRIFSDGRAGKFGWKGHFATLEEFVAAACANELGLGNPRMDQAKPWTHSENAKVGPDLNHEQFRALVAYVDTLPRPVEVLPEDSKARSSVDRGRMLFGQIGCAGCHIPDLGGVNGVYSDFLLHRLSRFDIGGDGYAEVPPTPRPHEHPLPDEWKTPALWGVAESTPYFHDGRTPTLEAAVLRHDGDAATVTKTYKMLVSDDQKAIIAFLKTLKAPTNPRCERDVEEAIALAR
jgi:CxxC motif-containing protein (DUF1111 family)